MMHNQMMRQVSFLLVRLRSGVPYSSLLMEFIRAVETLGVEEEATIGEEEEETRGNSEAAETSTSKAAEVEVDTVAVITIR